MRLLVQRVIESSVIAREQEIAKIKNGIVVFVGITQGDNEEVTKKMVSKLLKLRIWTEIPKIAPKVDVADDQEEEKQIDEVAKKDKTKPLKNWDTSVTDNNFEVLVVSQFTLYGVMKGNKPDFHNSLNPVEAEKVYDNFVELVKKTYKAEKVQQGGFGDYMQVKIVNDGPVTMILDSKQE